MRLFSYKMTHDTGFAPNPFHEILTLATCKPGIRKTKRKGDWIAGFSSNALTSLAGDNGINIDPDALIYLGKVSKRITMADYYKEYKAKIPRANMDSLIARAGDNIYKPLCKSPKNLSDFEQIVNDNHGHDEKNHDLSCGNVLIFDEFYYLGRKGKTIPVDIEISKPAGPTPYGYKTTDENIISKFIGWIKSEFDPGLNGMPCIWGDNLKNNKCGGCQ